MLEHLSQGALASADLHLAGQIWGPSLGSEMALLLGEGVSVVANRNSHPPAPRRPVPVPALPHTLMHIEMFQKRLMPQRSPKAAAILLSAWSHGCPLKGTSADRQPAQAKEPGRSADIFLSSALNAGGSI